MFCLTHGIQRIPYVSTFDTAGVGERMPSSPAGFRTVRKHGLDTRKGVPGLGLAVGAQQRIPQQHDHKYLNEGSKNPSWLEVD